MIEYLVSVLRVKAAIKYAILLPLVLISTTFDSFALMRSSIEIHESISARDFQRFSYLLKNLNPAVERKNILFLDWGDVLILRINDANYCEKILCLTYVVKNCNKQFCPYASALAGRNVNKPDHFSKERIANGNGVIITDEFEDKEIYIFFIVDPKNPGFVSVGGSSIKNKPKGEGKSFLNKSIRIGEKGDNPKNDNAVKNMAFDSDLSYKNYLQYLEDLFKRVP